MRRISAVSVIPLVLALAMAAQGPVRYRYVPVPQVEPGSRLYAWWDVSPFVPISTDVFAHLELQKSIMAEDQKGIDELKASGRMFTVPAGTEVKVLRFDKGVLAKVPSYEVRVMEGKHKDEKGWVVASWVWHRVAVPAKAKRKGR